MKTIILIFAALFSVQSYAGDSLDEQLAEAEKALKIAAKRIAELHAKGYGHDGAKRAMLGVLLGSEKMEGGVPISGTTPQGGAVQAGLKAGDKIVVIDGIDLSDLDNPLGTLSKHMKGVQPGEDVDVTYLRSGKRIEATITTQTRNAHVMKMIDGLDQDFDFDFDFEIDDEGIKALQKHALGSPKLMAVSGDFAEYFDVEDGVVVTSTEDDSELKGGDVLLEINDVEIASVEQTVELLANLDEAVPAKIKRRGRTRSVEINPHEFHGPMHQAVKVIKIIDKD